MHETRSLFGLGYPYLGVMCNGVMVMGGGLLSRCNGVMVMVYYLNEIGVPFGRGSPYRVMKLLLFSEM